MFKFYSKIHISKKEILALLMRLILLVLISLLITLYIFYEVKNLTTIKHVVLETQQENTSYTEEITISSPGKLFDEISSLVKTPLSLFYFNVCLQNYREAEGPNGEKLPVLMNVEINDTYSHLIKFNEKRIVAKEVRGTEIGSLLITRSFEIEDKNFSATNTKPLKGSFYQISIWPTLTSFLSLYFIIGIPLAYTILLLINACYRFILFGEPFISKM
ncbi:MAG: hypothetical protein LiPW30_158 [Parcubacteria group bacterium LiPW_30]|nr:MAG: hypothetical protein LiPW30_158 [Parcubacteria group bacterium LiPW_30]